MSSALLASVNLIHGHDPSNSDTILSLLFISEIISLNNISCAICISHGLRYHVILSALLEEVELYLQATEIVILRFSLVGVSIAMVKCSESATIPPAFIEQESLTDKNEIENSETDLRTEISSGYEFVSSNGPCYRMNEVSHLNTHSTDYFMNPLETPEIGQNTCSQLISQDSANFCGSLPSSFSALLTTCAAEAAEVQLSLAPEEINIKSQSMQYMSGSSFHGM
ncbi:hypothetical protein MKX01_038075 [Papaver californicum]|nr:hypothetical protein MKX01_038075 [Papaver californicum]